MFRNFSFLKSRFFKAGGYTLVTGAIAFAGLFFFGFNDPITKEDKTYTHLLVTKYNIDTNSIHASLQSEIDFIRSIQTAIYTLPTKDCIPLKHSRNIKDLYGQGCGMCYDKSHVMEKIFQMYGFETRHISIYYYKNWYQKFWTFFVPSSGSHAVSEVKTKGGWIFVDSVSEVIGLSEQNTVLSLSDIRKLLKEKKETKKIRRLFSFRHNFIYLYGVYSRNGYLYPPYNFVPDYKFQELHYNIVP
jgi:hypothetical protein